MLRQSLIFLLLFAFGAAGVVCGQKPGEPLPAAVDPGGDGRAPSDAIALFDGKDMSGWTTQNGGPARCEVRESVMHCRTGVGNILSKEKFRSAQVHLEFALPRMPEQKGQLRGNSGVYLQGRYEIQILNSYQNPTYPKGWAGALYGQAPPLVSASRPPAQWQTYDIIFHAPQCDGEGRLKRRGDITVLHNGVLVQDHVTIEASKGCEAGPLLLQDHSGFPGAPDTTLRFRNIWIRHLADPPDGDSQ